MFSRNDLRPVLILAALGFATLPSRAVLADGAAYAAVQAGGVPWHRDLATARAAAASSGRQVLVIFMASWNEPSSRFEAAVARSIEATTLLGSCFEPVRINVSEDPWTTRRMGVSNVPAACIIDDQENVIVRFDCPPAAEGFVAAVCKASREAAVAVVDQAAQQLPAGAGPSLSGAATSGPTPPAVGREAGPTESAGTAAPTADAIGLEGFCPVCLVTRQAWIQGDPLVKETYQGQTYCFSGEAERRAFLANPEWYAPALGGDDAVLAAKQGVMVAGRRAYSAAYKSRLYLFASPETRDVFVASPEQYTRRAQTARGTAPGGRVIR